MYTNINIKESFYPRLFEGVADKYAEKEFHIVDPDTEFEKTYKAKQVKEREKDKIIYNFDVNGKNFLIKNPTSLKNIAPEVRAVISKNGDLYVENTHNGTHQSLLNVLYKLKEVKPLDYWHLKLPKDFLTIQRVNDTNFFVIGESNEPIFPHYDEERGRRWKMPRRKDALPYYKEFIKNAQRVNPQFKFIPDIFSEVDKKIFEGVADKYAEKEFHIKDSKHAFINSNEYNVIATTKDQVPIIKNPKSLEDFEREVRAIADKEGNLYVALRDGEFNHGMMANVLIDVGIIKTLRYNIDGTHESAWQGIYEDQENFLLLNRLNPYIYGLDRTKNKFISSDTFEYKGKYTEKMLKNLKLKNPQFEYDLEKEYDLDESKIFESPDRICIDDKNYNNGRFDAYPFEVIVNSNTKNIIDVIIAKQPGTLHSGDVNLEGQMEGDPNEQVNYENTLPKYKVHWKKVYPGRLFLEPKVITFWVYPTNEELKTIINIIEEKLKIKIVNNGWKIEIYEQGLENRGVQRYRNNYNQTDATKYIPIENFVSSNKPPEEVYKQHLDTKTKHEVPFGYGSKNPKYLEKRQWQMATLGDESIQEPFYPKLNESPDGITLGDADYLEWDKTGAFAFGYFNEKLYIGKEGGSHSSIMKNGLSIGGRSHFKFAGRIWTKEKIISFWNYPYNRQKLIKILKDLEQKLDIRIINDPEWKIELAMNRRTYKSKIVPINKYIRSDKRSEEELAQQHVLSPLLKKKREVPYGFGSKNPKYIKNRQWAMADLQHESYYPKLNESPDGVYIENLETNKIEKEYLNYYEGTSYAFGYNLDNGVMQISREGHTHGDISHSRDSKYSGRIFIDFKLLTFWRFPENKAKLKEVAEDLQYVLKDKEDIKVDIVNDPEWRIEIPSDIITPTKGDETPYLWAGRSDNPDNIMFVSLNNYRQPPDRSEEELAKQHVLSPLLKKKREVPYGFGSKNPKYIKNRQWAMADLQHESYYPKLNEDNVIRQLDDNKNLGLNKKVIKIVKDAGQKDVKICLVNGDFVTAKEPGLGFKEFTEGGHHYVTSYPGYKKIPENEIWIDDIYTKEPERLKGFIQHEFIERNLMKYKKWSYDKAHDYANKKEAELRKKSSK